MKNQNDKFLCLEKTYAPCCFAWFRAIKFKTRIFWDLTKILFLGLLLRVWLEKATPENFTAWQDLWFLFFFMVLISNKGRDIDETWRDVCSFCFAYSCKMYNRVLITKATLAKLLKTTLDQSSKLKSMSDERLGCPPKSLLSQNFYWTMSDLLKTLILHPAYIYIYMHAHTHTHTHTHAHTHTYIYKNIYIYIYTHTHTHTHI